MKTLKLSTVATAICLLCMSMGFPNLATEEDEKDCKEKKGKARTTSVRTVALACTRQINVADKSVKEEEESTQPCTEKVQQAQTTLIAKIGCKKAA